MKHSGKRLVLLGLVCLVAVVLGAIGGPAVAVPPHKHCMWTPQGYVEVGPRVFDNPNLHEPAFHEFHAHVHVAAAPPTQIVGLLDPNLECSSLNP